MSRAKKALYVPVWIVIAYCVVECGFRIYRFASLSSDAKAVRYSFTTFRTPIYTLDRQAGYAYLPNLRDEQWFYSQDNTLVPHTSTVVTNNFGMISPNNATIEKPHDEFRIAVLGDSFCATTPSDVTWPTALETILNKDEQLKRQVGKSSFKVLNFGLDGTGIVQWPSVYQYKAAKFDPDLVVVNFISDDIFRKYIYRDTLKVGSDDYALFTCDSTPVDVRKRDCRNALSFVIDPTREDYKQKAARIKGEIHRALVRRLPWFSPYPEFLATFLGGPLGLKPRLEIVRAPTPHYVTSEEAIPVSLDALRKIHAMHASMVVLFHPTVEQCLSGKAPPAVLKLMDAAREMKVINMLEWLPVNSGQDEIRRWYNLPYDAHPSNYGAEVYARAAEGQIAAFIDGGQ